MSTPRRGGPIGPATDASSRTALPAFVRRLLRRLGLGGTEEGGPGTPQDPVRGELFGPERLERHAARLASRHRVDRRDRAGAPVLDRLEENRRVLGDVHRALVRAAERDETVSPAAEWFLDNSHVVKDQVREAADALPEGFQRQLPKLAGPELEGHPRVYGIALEFVGHTDSRFEPEDLKRFLEAYQSVSPLEMGEIWALPTALRLVLVENLRRLAEHIARARQARTEAQDVVDRIREGEGVAGEVLDSVLPDGRLDPDEMDRAFVVELVQRLRDVDGAAPAPAELERRLERAGLSAEELVREEHTRQLAAQATVANVVTSMRKISAYGWAEFFEDVSLVERTLRRDPGGLYARSDFATRDAYRHAVEDLARGSDRDELEVAERAVRRTEEARRRDGDEDGAAGDGRGGASRARHLGHHLTGEGRRAFEEELGFDPSVRERLVRAFRAGASPGYFGTLGVLTAAPLAVLLAWAAAAGVPAWAGVLLGALALVPATDLAQAILHAGVPRIVPPRRLPKLEFDEGIPPEHRTLVAVPTMLNSREDVRGQAELLEERYLSNQAGHLAFALLTDWHDAPRESMPGDRELLDAAAEAVADLNERHGPGPDGRSRFLLLHRGRVRNEAEGVWMGWERKRGKLEELNRLLRGDGGTTYMLRDDGLTDVAPDVQYVLTLDADTRLPPGSARRLVGAMAHPLNRPVHDPSEGRVVEGYGVLQPRITPLLPAPGERSLYHRLYAGPTGIDPYSSAASDVYQDLFGVGTFVGKGIYDVDAFREALEGRVPENALLSHDHFEGAFARCGLVSDIELFDDFPTSHEADARRAHRWARGDWQLLPWLVGRAPEVEGRDVPARPPFLSWWKMADNLRRSLSPVSSLLLLVAGWALMPVAPAAWAAFVVATLAVPAAVPLVGGVLPRGRETSLRRHVRGVAADAREAAARVAVEVTFLAGRAWLMADACVRTLYRLCVSGRGMLEWTPAALAGRGFDGDVARAFRRQWRGPAVAAASAAAVGAVRPEALPTVLPVAALWAAAPAVSWWLSRPLRREPTAELSPGEARELRRTARESWRYFEETVTEEESWLPPDNVQVDPERRVAHRTSPTNVGVYLLSCVAAHDFGWIGARETAERLEATLDALEGLERLRGHFFNWYDTRSGAPMEPRYVSTVDSGNLACHLLTVAEACRDIRRGAPRPARAGRGIGDAVACAREATAPAEAGRREGAGRPGVDAGPLSRLGEMVGDLPVTAAGWGERLRSLGEEADRLVEAVEGDPDGDTRGAAPFWTRAVARAVRSHRRDLETMAPGALPSATAPGPWAGVAPERWRTFLDRLDTLAAPARATAEAEWAAEEARQLRAEAARAGTEAAQRAATWLEGVIEALRRGGAEAAALDRRLGSVAARAEALARETDFGLVYDGDRKLFSIGYRPDDDRLDEGYYDLLASEARVASLVAVARGDVPTEHWFHLGRSLVPVDHGAALVSWSGSMFEYLMPYLVMEPPEDTLLDRTQRQVVRRQIEYGRERGVPWGVSESAFNARDLELTYQYSHFGIPGLGLARGLADDLVVAPYATALAAMVDPAPAVRNLRRLERLGARGGMGFYEAVDFTPDRLSADQEFAVIGAYMAHHQGMTVTALANVLHDGLLRERFHRIPSIGAVEVLLQERVPRAAPVSRPPEKERQTAPHVREIERPVARRFTSPHRRPPATHLLSNGRYRVMVTAAGGGYSRWEDLAVTRWREDPTRDRQGTFVYLRDVESGRVWSAGWQPTGTEPDEYTATFSEDRAEFRRRDGPVSTATEVVVSPEEDGELRRVTVRNQGSRPRRVEVTSYAEVVLATPDADAAHPAFEKLFVRTEFEPSSGAVLATRRRRSPEEPEVWAAHVAAVEGETVGGVQYETDRSRFLERGRTAAAPAAVVEGRPLSNSTGPVLDPVFSLRRTVRIAPGGTARITFSTLMAESRDEAANLAEVHDDPSAFGRAAGLAWTQAQVQLQHLGVDPDEAHVFQRLASHVIHPGRQFRVPPVVERNDRGQSDLWKFGISGDRPLVVVRIDQVRDRGVVRQLVRAHEYWGWKGLDADLVVLNEHPVSYKDELQGWLGRLVRSEHGPGSEEPRPHGDVRVLRADELSDEDLDLLRAAARIVLHARDGSLSEQLESARRREEAPLPPRRPPPSDVAPEAPPSRPGLSFFNGLGGFADDGREYVIVLGEGQWTPAPWVNVVANPEFGFVVSESGAGFTWAGNSRENRLTPWSNDPVSDPPGEAFYLRDQETGEVWTPTPLPVREATPYRIAHGQGWSRFEHTSHGVSSELLQFVAPDDPVKISRLRLRNESDRPRALSVAGYVEWALGVRRERSAPHVVTEIDGPTGALFARNAWNREFAGRPAFFDMAGRQESWTADRAEFVGRNGDLSAPAGLAREATELSGTTGAALDPCAVLARPVTLDPGESADLLFLLGQGSDTAEARSLVQRYRDARPGEVLEAVETGWNDTLATVQVDVPDESMEVMLNRWLPYQVLSCRVWARSAFYQSGGAYGFRDQLQDVMALTVARRALVREHVLRTAGRQFPEGDVQHWWHPPSGRGVRTRISDDLLWLPFAVLHYLDVTGEEEILDEEVPFLEGPELAPDEEERYFEPDVSERTASLFEHCARAVDARLETGPHGLPLIGTGDWNDGMNRVGREGQGESVWMGWFLHVVLDGLAPIAERRGENHRAATWRRHRDELADALERNAWDGDWFRRAYFDDGTPLGSASNEECRIDSIAQSWAVLSGAARPWQQERAMQAVQQYLVRRGDGLVLLFTPPFDDGDLDPGYIRGYLPGVRENGGQYTHAAMWSVLAFAELGKGDEAAELFSVLNPVNQAATRAGAHRYRVEPYVSAGDVYSEPPHTGRGGWTWYTGSAGWMYRAGLEWILGFRLRGDVLRIDPCIPREWPGFAMTFRYHSALYEIEVDSPGGAMRGVVEAEMDGTRARPVEGTGGGGGGAAGRTGDPAGEEGGERVPRVDDEGAWIPLDDDGAEHRVVVRLG